MVGSEAGGGFVTKTTDVADIGQSWSTLTVLAGTQTITDTYFINDTTKFKINSSNGTVQNNTVLGIGTYQLNVSVNDTSGNVNSTYYQVTVQVSVAPNVTLISPADSFKNYSAHSNITFNCSATDDTDLRNISLYLTNSSMCLQQLE